MSKSVDDATADVKEYLYSQNRPYSCNDIFNNLQNKFNKATVQKALDSLTSSTDICEKLNGKQKVYFANQLNFEVNEQKLKEVDIEIENINKNVELLKKSINDKEIQIKKLKNHVPMEELCKKHESLKEQNAQLQDRLSNVKTKCQNLKVTAEEQSKMKKVHCNLTNELKKRKRLASQVFDMILENYPKSKKAFFDEVGIETDEDAVK